MNGQNSINFTRPITLLSILLLAVTNTNGFISNGSKGRFGHSKPLNSEMSPSTTSDGKTASSSYNPASIKGVLFDIDGTLADSWKLGYDATQEVLIKNSIEQITEEIYHDHTRYCTPDRLARHAGLMPGDADFESVGERLGKEFDDLYVDLVSVKTAGFYDDIEAMLGRLRPEVKVGALTNACVAYAHAVLQKNCPVYMSGESDDAEEKKTAAGGLVPVYDRFTAIHGADDVPKPKPNPDGLLLCCEEMGVDPKDCVYIGDSPSDAMAAEAAGMTPIGVMWGSHGEEKLKAAPFQFLCSSVEELAQLLPIAN